MRHSLGSAKNYRHGVEKKGLLDQVDQAKQYSESAKQALDTVTVGALSRCPLLWKVLISRVTGNRGKSTRDLKWEG